MNSIINQNLKAMKKVLKAFIALTFIAMLFFLAGANVKADEQQGVPCYMDYGWLDCLCFGPAEQCILTYCSQGCEGVIVVAE